MSAPDKLEEMAREWFAHELTKDYVEPDAALLASLVALLREVQREERERIATMFRAEAMLLQEERDEWKEMEDSRTKELQSACADLEAAEARLREVEAELKKACESATDAEGEVSDDGGAVMVLPISDKEYIAELEEERDEWHKTASRVGAERDELGKTLERERQLQDRMIKAGNDAHDLLCQLEARAERAEAALWELRALVMAWAEEDPDLQGPTDALEAEAKRLRAALALAEPPREE
jgi:chromosome segregation ATPase